MKICLTVFFLWLCLWPVESMAYFPAYKAVTVKTNMLSFFNASIDVPVYKRMTAECSVRQIWQGSSAFPRPGISSTRFNVKYHIPLQRKDEFDPSFFLFSGIHVFKKDNAYFNDQSNSSYVVEAFNGVFAPVGLGFKFRRSTFWMAYECPVHIVSNSRTYPYRGGQTYSWIDPYTMVSGGFALTLFNIRT